MTSVFTKKDSRCAACFKMTTGAFRSDEPHEVYKPKAGDLSVCVYCSNLAMFNADLSLHTLTAAELESLEEEDRAELLRAQRVIQEFNVLERKAK
jgi:hypothetical protein